MQIRVSHISLLKRYYREKGLKTTLIYKLYHATYKPIFWIFRVTERDKNHNLSEKSRCRPAQTSYTVDVLWIVNDTLFPTYNARGRWHLGSIWKRFGDSIPMPVRFIWETRFGRPWFVRFGRKYFLATNCPRSLYHEFQIYFDTGYSWLVRPY